MKYLIRTLIPLLCLFSIVVHTASTTAKQFGQWQVDCSTQPCFINQALIASNGQAKGVVAALNIMEPQPNKQVLSLRISPNALMKAGIGLKVDNHKDIRVKIISCDEQVCQTNILVDQTLANELAEGRLLRVVYLDSRTQKQVTLPFMLHGYSRAIAALSQG